MGTTGVVVWAIDAVTLPATTITNKTMTFIIAVSCLLLDNGTQIIIVL
jgi:hypothetical protein